MGKPCDHMQANGADLVVAPPAVQQQPATAPDLAYAEAHQIPVVAWPALLGMVLADQCVCAVVGPAATQTATRLVQILRHAGEDPSYAIGSQENGGVHQGRTALWIVTTDAAYGNLRHLHPRLALITHVPDEAVAGYNDPAEVQRTFDAFVAGMDLYQPWPYAPTLILNGDDPGCRLLAARMAAWPGQIVRFALTTPGVEIQATPVPGNVQSLRVREQGGGRGYRMPVSAADPSLVTATFAASCAARHLGVGLSVIAQSISAMQPTPETAT